MFMLGWVTVAILTTSVVSKIIKESQLTRWLGFQCFMLGFLATELILRG